MTTADQSDSNDEWPDAIGPERKDDSGQRQSHNHEMDLEEHHPDRADADPAERDQPARTAGLPPPVVPGGPPPPNANGLLLFVAAILAFAVLITVGVVLMLPRANPSSATEPGPQQTSPAPVTRELGTVDSTAAGVKGHLTTRWDGKLAYNFLIEPDDLTRQAAFALTASNPPRPASFRIQIKNSNGVVVCFQDVLLKFNPRRAAAISDASLQNPSGRSSKAAEELKSEQEAELAQEEATEAEREHGHNFFQLNAGSDGKIASISSQGEIPCPQTSYEGMGYWSFVTDFPSPEEQTEWLKQQAGALAQANLAPVQQVQPQASRVPVQARQVRGQAQEAPSMGRQGPGHKRLPYKSVPQPETFLMAGDDSIVEYDTAAGSIETRTGKIFSIDKTGTAARVIAGYDLPVRIHYSCDQNAACTLTQGSSMAVHAHLDK